MSNTSKDPVELGPYYQKQETDKAILIRIDDDNRNTVWIPKSQIVEGTYRYDKGMVFFALPEWLATDKGLV